MSVKKNQRGPRPFHVSSADIRQITKIHRKQLPKTIETGCAIIDDNVKDKDLPFPDQGCVIIDDDITDEQLAALKSSD
jgi:hypothetical protein